VSVGDFGTSVEAGVSIVAEVFRLWQPISINPTNEAPINSRKGECIYEAGMF
jgi:hypothetical protein